MIKIREMVPRTTFLQYTNMYIASIIYTIPFGI